ncbi:hypothetical protein [Geomonas edaphica]|uniref:hypothetical protein n=1 Tax=Geomonas edaphica TaxID=2570226 RepID=UPI0010A84C49|nr:hypothetical protein [Geomonas edaphica]
MKKTTLVIFAVLSLQCVARGAGADTVEITYSSGKVQTIDLEGKAKEVHDIRLKEVTTVPLPEKIRDLFKGEKPGQQPSGNEQPPAAKKTGPTFKWAPPVSE